MDKFAAIAIFVSQRRGEGGCPYARALCCYDV
jgi:hypothetical protein